MTTRYLSTALPVALLAFAFSWPAHTQAQGNLPTAQSTAQPATTPAAAIEAPIHTLTLDVVAAHKSQPPVADLEPSAFTLLDNKTPRPITSCKAFSGDNTPVSVTLVIDAVNTNFSNLSGARGQIDAFLKANSGHLAHPTRIAIFTDTRFVVQPTYTRDGNALADWFDQQALGLRDIRRSSGFYGADERTQLSLNALSGLAQNELKIAGRKLVLWVSPGWPLLSGPGVELDSKQSKSIFHEVVELSSLLRDARITVYSVDPVGAAESVGRALDYEQYTDGLRKFTQADLGDLALQVLAVQSGGRAFSGSNDVGGMIKSAYEEGSAYYELTFEPTPAEHPDEYHQIEVKVNQPGLTVRTRQGYYNQP